MYLDVIGIGAINYDYIFFCKKLEYRNRSMPEFGQEYLSSSVRETLEDEIDTMLFTTPHDIQFCGSAYFAIKTVNAIYPELKTSYVGVCGNPTRRERKAGFTGNIEDEFKFLYNKDWLFYDDGPPGIALIRLFKGTRNWIDINAGVNNNLVQHIERKKQELGQNAFVDFLANTKWIHISSLADFNQFQYLISEVEKAKEINPWLKVSFDPGYEYTKKYRLQLREAFKISDYIFLNKNEVDNLTGNSSLKGENQFSILSSILNKDNNGKNVIVIKGKNHHQIINYLEGVPYTKTFWHSLLKPYQIHNDTGAGDAFAGGLIAALLSNDMLVQEEAAIHLGAVAASARMKAKAEPFECIHRATNKFLRIKQKNEQLNFYQRLRLEIDNKKSVFVGIITAIITGLISSFLWEIIIK